MTTNRYRTETHMVIGPEGNRTHFPDPAHLAIAAASIEAVYPFTITMADETTTLDALVIRSTSGSVYWIARNVLDGPAIEHDWLW